MPEIGRPLTAYEILRVQPSAPANLIVACYWDLAKDIRTRHSNDADIQLHALARAFEAVSDPDRRAAYDASLGIEPKPLISLPLPKKRFFLARIFRPGVQGWHMDPHEVLGLQPDALQSSIPEAYRLARNSYLRIAPGRRRETLLGMVEDAYAVISDPERRSRLSQSAVHTSGPVAAQPRNEKPVKQKPVQAPKPEKRRAESPPSNPPAAPEPRPQTEMASHQPVPAATLLREAPRQPETPAAVALTSKPADVKVAPAETPVRRPDVKPSAPPAEKSPPEWPRRLASVLKLAAAIAKALMAALWWLLLALGRMLASAWARMREIVKRWWADRVEARRAGERQSATDDMFLGRLASTVNDKQSERAGPATKAQVSSDER
jgi:hypothetical protein